GVLKLSGFSNEKFFTRASSRTPRKKRSTYWDGATTRILVGSLVEICLSRSSQKSLFVDCFSSQILSNIIKTFFPDRSCLKKFALGVFPSIRVAPNVASSGSEEDHSGKLCDRCNGSVPYSIDNLK